MEIPSLTTERLLLRSFRADDFEFYAELNANQEVMRYIDAVQDRVAAFRSFCAAIGHWTARGYGPWAIEERESGRLVGRAGLLRWEDWPGLEVGYTLHPSAWGRGYATEAARRALRYAHEVLCARGVISLIQPQNAASIRVADRLGARFARESTVHGHLVHVYAHPDR
jgi:RimJ/RimL family protein N-acetyltransferase